MTPDLQRAQYTHDTTADPAAYLPEPVPPVNALCADFWYTIQEAMHMKSTHTLCEVLGGPATTFDHTSIDVTLGCDRPASAKDVAAMLRAGAEAAEKWAESNGEIETK